MARIYRSIATMLVNTEVHIIIMTIVQYFEYRSEYRKIQDLNTLHPGL